MNELARQIKRARRRLGLQRYVGAVGWCLGVALLVSAIPAGLGQYLSWTVPAWTWIAAAGAIGLAAALVWTFLRDGGPLDAAIEIDRRFALRERVSSAWSLDEPQRVTESGQALLADALAHVHRIDVSGQFRVRPVRSLLVPVLPAVVLTLVIWLVHAPAVDPTAQATASPAAQVEQVRKSADPLQRKLAQQREEVKKLGLQEAEALFKKLEQGTEAMTRGEFERKEAQIKLKNLSDMVQARRDQLGNTEQVRQQLNQMKDVAKGPAEQMAKAVAKGDFAKALNELDKLREAIEKGDFTQQQKQDMTKQLHEMQDRINEMAKAHRDAQKALQEQVDKLAQSGRQGEADKLQEQLDKLRQQMPQINQLQDLAQQMGQCSKCLDKGQVKDAKQALDAMAGQLQQMKKQLEEMEALDEAMAQLNQAQQQLACDKCGGAGCKACQGPGGGADQDGEQRQGGGQGGHEPGTAPGRLFGDSPTKPLDAKTYDSQVRQKVGQGAGTITGTVHGPNVKGQVMQEIQTQTTAVRQGETDPLAEQKIPRQQRDHAREYFNKFRKGE